MNIGTELDLLFDPMFFPAKKEELLDLAIREGASKEMIDLLEGLQDDDPNYRYRGVQELNPANSDLSDFFNYEDDEY